MARIAGVDLPPKKQIGVSLTYIYGIGHALSKKILQGSGVNESKKTSELSGEEVARIREVLERDCKVEGDLRKEISSNIKRLIDLGCYRGSRHRRSLPVRGQRSHTNARTRKGPRKAIGGRKG